MAELHHSHAYESTTPELFAGFSISMKVPFRTTMCAGVKILGDFSVPIPIACFLIYEWSVIRCFSSLMFKLSR